MYLFIYIFLKVESNLSKGRCIVMWFIAVSLVHKIGSTKSYPLREQTTLGKFLSKKIMSTNLKEGKVSELIYQI